MVADDVILEQAEFVCDSSENVVSTTVRQRYHAAPDSQTASLDKRSTAPRTRVIYAAAYLDALGRIFATADYGTNSGTAIFCFTTSAI